MIDLYVVILLISIPCILLSMFQIIFWIFHILKCKHYCSTYGWGSYKQFKREFNKYEWRRHYGLLTRTLYSNESGTRIHDGLIQFNRKGMIMRDPVSYLLAMNHVDKMVDYRSKSTKIRNKIKW